MINKLRNKKNIKIAFFCLPQILFENGSLIKSGSVIINEQIIDYLRKQGHDVLEFSPLSKQRIALSSISGIGNTLMFQEFLDKIDDINKCDVVVTTNYFGSILPEIKKPVVTIFHHVAKSLICAVDRKTEIDERDTYKHWLNKAQKLDLAHDTDEMTHQLISSIVEQQLIDLSACVVAVSQKSKDDLMRYYEVKESKISVINNSYSSGWENLFNVDEKPDQTMLTVVTRMPASKTGFFMKGADRIIEVLKKTNNKIQKTLVASVDDPKYGLFFESEIPSVKYLENLSHDQVCRVFNKSSISFHASRIESFGLTIVESMLMGNVPITFSAGIAEDIIEHGKNGFIVHSCAEAIKIINQLYKTPEKIKAMGLLARDSVLKKLSSEKMLEDYEKVLITIARQ